MPIFIPITSPSCTKSTLRNGLGPGDRVKGGASITNVPEGGSHPEEGHSGGLWQEKEQVTE